VGLSEAAAFRARLNTLNTQNGRSLDTSCAICLEPLEQPGGDADEDAASDGGRGAAYVQAMDCGHQFHFNCISTWRHTRSSRACPICKKVTL